MIMYFILNFGKGNVSYLLYYRCGKDPKCTSKEFSIQPDKSRFIDFQIVRLQELPEDLPPGQLASLCRRHQ